MSNLLDPTNDPYVIDGVNMRLLARRQRWVLWLVLLLVLCEIAPYLSGPGAVIPGGLATYLKIVLVVSFAIRIIVVVYGLLLMGALRTNVFVMIVCAILLFLPFFNLIILLLENRNAT